VVTGQHEVGPNLRFGLWNRSRECLPLLPIQSLILCDSESAPGYTLRGTQLWVDITVDHPFGVFIEDFTGNQCHETHLGLQILEIQRPYDEAGQDLRPQ